MITIPFTIFDKAIRTSFEKLFIELLKIYKSEEAYPFHFIGQSQLHYLSDDDLSDSPDYPSDYNEKVLYIKNRIEKDLEKNPHYSKIQGLSLLPSEEQGVWYLPENIKVLSELVNTFNATSKKIISEFISEENERLYPIRRYYKITDFGLEEALIFCYQKNRAINPVHDFFFGIKPFNPDGLIDKLIEQLSTIGDKEIVFNKKASFTAKGRVKKYYDELFYSLELKAESLFTALEFIEFWQFHGYNLPDYPTIKRTYEEEHGTIIEEIFEEGIDFAAYRKGLEKDKLDDKTWRSLHFPSGFELSSIHYEFFPPPIIISNYAYLTYLIGDKAEIDWDHSPSVWIPKEILASCEDEYPLPTMLLLCLVRRLYSFEQNLKKQLKTIHKRIGTKNKKQTLQYLIDYYQRVNSNPKIKVTILEGIKFPKSIINLFLDTMISILNKSLHSGKGTIYKSEFMLTEDANTIRDEDYQLSDNLQYQIDLLEGEIELNEAHYYPYKLYWDTKKYGSIEEIFAILQHPSTTYKGKVYMEQEVIHKLIQRNFTFQPLLESIEKSQISLPFNSFIGPIREFFYLLREKYYKDIEEERFAQIIRDNFFNHFEKNGFDLSFASLQKIASNMHKGAKKIPISLSTTSK